LARQEELATLRQCMETLRRANIRETVALKMAGLSMSEIGRALGCRNSTIQGWLKLALEHLRRCMDGRGFTDGD